jgi:sugar/nucleoside kinase (ribokinase family)
MSLLVVGSVAFDTVETPFGKREQALGGSASFFSMSASFFTKVDLVAVVGDDFPEQHIQLFRSRGIGMSGLSRAKGKTFHWSGSYGFDLNTAQTRATDLNVFQTFSPDLPAELRKSEIVMLGNIDPDLQWRVLEQVEKPRIVAADTMNFWITGKPAELKRTLSKVDLLLVNDAEARQLSGEHNIVKAARAINAMGPKRLVIKRGEYGALLFDEQHIFAAPAFPLPALFDPTGAGDSFAGGLLGSLDRSGNIDSRSLRRSTIIGSVICWPEAQHLPIGRGR